MESSFNNVVDDWSKQMAFNLMDAKNKKAELTKSQSEVEIRNKDHDMYASTPNIEMTKSGIIDMSKS